MTYDTKIDDLRFAVLMKRKRGEDVSELKREQFRSVFSSMLMGQERGEQFPLTRGVIDRRRAELLAYRTEYLCETYDRRLPGKENAYGVWIVEPSHLQESRRYAAQQYAERDRLAELMGIDSQQLQDIQKQFKTMGFEEIEMQYHALRAAYAEDPK